MSFIFLPIRLVDIHGQVMRDQKLGNAPAARQAARALDAGWTEAEREEHRAIDALKVRLDSAYDSALWNEWFNRKSRFYERVGSGADHGRAAPSERSAGPRQVARAAEAALERAQIRSGSGSGGEYGH